MKWQTIAISVFAVLIIGACDNNGDQPADDAGSDVVADVDEDTEDVEDTADTADVDAEDSSDDAETDATDTEDGHDVADGDTGGGELVVAYDFANSDEGWTAGVADYSPTQSDSIDFTSGIEALPDEVAETSGETGYLLSGKNVSDDLAMFLTRALGPADGIQANQGYEVSYRLVFASDAPSNCVGVGGAPGESVYLKAGAARIEPMAVEQDGDIRMNVDKGNQSTGGINASVVGNIANGIPCEEAIDDNYPYVSLTKEHTHTEIIEASDDGELWLLVLTDSGFESTTALYYQEIEATLTPQ